MISEECRSRIRRLFFAEHWKVGTIAAELGVHRDTVALAIEAQRFVNIPYRATATLLDAYKPFVKMTLEQHPRLRATRLLEMIQQRGYTGSIWPLRRYVVLVRPTSPHEACSRRTCSPACRCGGRRRSRRVRRIASRGKIRTPPASRYLDSRRIA